MVSVSLNERLIYYFDFISILKAVYSENAVSELMLINTIHLFYHAMRAPKIEVRNSYSFFFLFYPCHPVSVTLYTKFRSWLDCLCNKNVRQLCLNNSRNKAKTICD